MERSTYLAVRGILFGLILLFDGRNAGSDIGHILFSRSHGNFGMRRLTGF
jgi:hypothetical protein